MTTKKETCGRGHCFTSENTYRPPSASGRRCRECGRLYQRRYRQRKRAEAHNQKTREGRKPTPDPAGRGSAV